MNFSGTTFEESDRSRLTAQFERVRAAMLDGQWRTLGDIETLTQDPQASVSARLRDLRKPQFGGYVVERRRVQGARGLFQYRVLRATVAEVQP